METSLLFPPVVSVLFDILVCIFSWSVSGRWLARKGEGRERYWVCSCCNTASETVSAQSNSRTRTHAALTLALYSSACSLLSSIRASGTSTSTLFSSPCKTRLVLFATVIPGQYQHGYTRTKTRQSARARVAARLAYARLG